MIELTCQNKRCQYLGHYKENKKIYQCPICRRNLYNWEKIITKDNYLWIEQMIKNIETYGENTLKMIDDCYPKAETRLKVRQYYFKTLKELEE